MSGSAPPGLGAAERVASTPVLERLEVKAWPDLGHRL